MSLTLPELKKYLRYRKKGLNDILEDLNLKLDEAENETEMRYYREQISEYIHYVTELDHIYNYIDKHRLM